MSAVVLGVGNASVLFKGLDIGGVDAVTIIDAHDDCASAFDLSVLRGDGIFEATTVYDGFPVSLENHLKRLAHSAALVDMPEPDVDAFTDACQGVIDAYDGAEEAPMLRILVSRGLDPTTGIGVEAERSGNGPLLPSVWIFLDGVGAGHSIEPITMATLTRGYPSDITSKAPWLLNGAKTLSYAVNQAMHRECDRRGVGDAVTTTTDGYTLECPNSSIVARYGDTYVTPDPRIGILNGTSQRELFAWALEEGKRTAYRKLPVDELRDADALYMTHGGWVVPVKELDGKAYAVDMDEIRAMNEAIHSGRTHDDALTIGPSGDYDA